MIKNKKGLMFVFSFIFLAFAFFANFGNIVQVNASGVNNSKLVSNSILATEDLSTRYRVKEGATLPEDTTNIGGIITSVSDNLLSQKLLNIYKNYDPRYDSNYLRIDMFKDFEMLDLSSIVQGTSNVIDLSGLKFLNFESLKELNLSNNNIENFDVTYFPGVKTTTNEDGSKNITVDVGSPVLNITTLNISNNNLSGELDVTYFQKLTNLNIANNNYTNVKFATTQESDCYLDYRNNKISNYGNLTLPEYADTKLILFGNPLKDVKEGDVKQNISLEIGLLNLGDELNSSTYIKYIAFDILPIDVKIYTKTTNTETNEVVFEEYNYNPQNLTNFMFKLGANNYKIDFVDRDADEVLTSKEVTVTPPIAQFNFVIKGKDKGDYYTEKITNKAYIYFNVVMENGEPKRDSDGNLVLINENITVYYRYSNIGDWIEGNVCDLTKRNGTYGLNFKTVENGIDSQVRQIQVQVSYNKFIPDIGLVIIIILIMIFLALVIVPLIKKLLDKISKPN